LKAGFGSGPDGIMTLSSGNELGVHCQCQKSDKRLLSLDDYRYYRCGQRGTIRANNEIDLVDIEELHIDPMEFR